MNEAVQFVAFIAELFLYVSEIMIFKRQENRLTRLLHNKYIVLKNICTF